MAVAERFQFYKIRGEGTGIRLGKAVTGHLHEQERITKGVNRKHLVQLTLESPDEHRSAYVGSFISRAYMREDQQPFETDIEFWDAQARALLDMQRMETIRKAGIRVPDVIRYFQDRQGTPTLLLSDITRGGERYVWAANHDGPAQLAKLGITRPGLQAVEEQLRDFGAKATDISYVLTDRTYVIVGSPDHEPEVYASDPDGITDYQQSIFSPGEIARYNTREVEQYIRDVRASFEATAA